MSAADERRLTAHLRARIAAPSDGGGESVRLGPFLACFDRSDESPFRNYAVPDDHCRPHRRDVERLIAASLGRGRLPRVEYLPATAPRLAGPLGSASFVVERRVPVMVRRRRAAPPEAPDGYRTRAVRPGGADALAALTVARRVFGGGPPDDADVARLEAELAAGGGAVLAVDRHGGEVVGTGRFDAPAAGTTELTGVCVVPDHRRRGVAGALTAALATGAEVSGAATVWLSPEAADACRVYHRVGFRTLTELRHLVYAGAVPPH